MNTPKLQRSVYFCLFAFFILIFTSVAAAFPAFDVKASEYLDAHTPPAGYVPIVAEIHEGNTDALLIEDLLPWGKASIEGVFSEFGITYDLVHSSTLADVDLSEYKFIVYPSDQPSSFYWNIQANIERIESFVANGGLLIAHVTDSGWNVGSWDGLHILPGGVTHENLYEIENLSIVDVSHPVIQGTPPGNIDILALNPDYLDGWGWSTHGYLNNLPFDTQTVVEIESGDWAGQPTYVDYDYGNGKVLATMQTVEWGYGTDGTDGNSCNWCGPRPELLRNEMRFALEWKLYGVEIIAPQLNSLFWITNQYVHGKDVPVMPSIQCQARLVGFTQSPFTKFSWEAHIEYLHYLYVGENNGDYIYSAETQEGTYVGAGNGNCIQVCSESDLITGSSVGNGFWIPSFRNIIMGGVLKIKVKTTVFYTEYSDDISVCIRAENPVRQSIRDRLGKPIYQVICYMESLPKWYQFYATGDPRAGLPVCAFDCGYGLMQITYPNPTVPQIWDWRENIDRGKEMFDDKYDAAKTYINTLISNMKTTDKEEAKIMKKSLPKYVYEREACCRYRGGYYYCWDAINDAWIRDPSSLYPNSQDYADAAISILAGIEADPPSFPPNW
jgi:hypothetical protein